MQKLFKILIIPFLAVLLMVGNLFAYTIDDNYIGADSHGLGDVIGSSLFEIHGMDVNFSNGFMDVVVYTKFDDESPGAYGETYGDLFISTDGWNPYGAPKYAFDDYSNGEDWEFVFDTSAGTLYSLPDYTEDNIKDYITLSDSGGGYTRRDDQEVLYSGRGTAIIDQSSVDLSQAGQYLFYQIELASLGAIDGSVIGLKWGETCANDTIEGGVAVPEPANMFLLGTALIGLAGLGRKRLFKN